MPLHVTIHVTQHSKVILVSFQVLVINSLVNQLFIHRVSVSYSQSVVPLTAKILRTLDSAEAAPIASNST